MILTETEEKPIGVKLTRTKFVSIMIDNDFVVCFSASGKLVFTSAHIEVRHIFEHKGHVDIVLGKV